MSDASVEDQVRARIAAAGLIVSPDVVRGCCVYLTLLARWNGRINLTALPLTQPIPDHTVDKLIVEPLCAVSLLPSTPSFWIDLGSGGGSPAIPLRLAASSGALTMVESRARKCAFLREAVRVLGLAKTQAVAERFETFTPSQTADLVTIRAVRVDDELVDLIVKWMKPGGMLVCFGASVTDDRFSAGLEHNLPDGSSLATFVRV